jgi:YfiH family protein
MKIDLIKPGIFPKNVLAGVTKRIISDSFPRGISFSRSAGISEDELIQNRKILAGQTGIDYGYFKFQRQVHGDRIIVVDYQTDTDSGESDGMVTNKPGIALAISIADCAAILAFDPENLAIGAVHSGWRGTKQKITANLINLMDKQFNTSPENLLVYVSPCAGGENYEVGDEFAELFPRSVKYSRSGKLLFDNKKELRLQLLESGVRENNLELSDICTIKNDAFHSYRRDRGNSGRMAAFIALKEL